MDRPYQVIRHGQTTILVMNKRAAGLVSAALDIVNPDDYKNEELAREMALALEP
jgi:hypothetical protein